MRKFFFILSSLIFICSFPQKSLIKQSEIKNLLHGFFVPNHGQWSKEVLFLASTNNYQAWILDDGIIISLWETPPASDLRNHLDGNTLKHGSFRVQNIKINFGSNISSHVIQPINPLPGVHHYIFGNDPSKWKTHIPIYQKVIVKDFYDGNDAHFNIDHRGLRLDLKTNGLYENPFKGKISIISSFTSQNTEDKVIIMTDNGLFEICFENNDSGWSLVFNANETRKKSTIQDSLSYSTYFGSTDYETAMGITVDNQDYVYIAGLAGANFPITAGSFQTTYAGYGDLFISKLNLATSTLIYSTFVGGNNSEGLHDISIDSDGNVTIVGWTASTDFPTSQGTIQQTPGGELDGFVTKLNSNGSGLIFSTYLGGADDDYCRSVATDSQGNTYIAGTTESTDFPVTLGSFQILLANWTDAFVTKINPTGNQLIYSTYVGGVSADNATALAIDTEGFVYITGRTSSSNFPVTSGAYQTTHANPFSDDVFVSKLNKNGSGLVFSTFLGGVDDDEAEAIAIDSQKRIYITGKTVSSNFPVTSSALQSVNNGNDDIFISCLSEGGDQLLYSTFYGGSSSERGRSLDVDLHGFVYVFGNTQSTDFPVSSDAFQTSFAGGSTDAFFLAFHPVDTSIVYSTFLGGNNDDYGISIDVKNHGEVYLTGSTQSTNFPTTSNSYQSSHSGGLDIYITKMLLNFPNLSITTFDPDASIVIYPNPSSNQVFIELNQANEIEIYDSFGKLVLKHRVNADEKKLTLNLRQGMYFIKETSSHFSQKIVVY